MSKKTKHRKFFKVFLAAVVLMSMQGTALGFDTSEKLDIENVKRAAQEADAAKKKAEEISRKIANIEFSEELAKYKAAINKATEEVNISSSRAKRASNNLDSLRKAFNEAEGKLKSKEAIANQAKEEAKSANQTVKDVELKSLNYETNSKVSIGELTRKDFEYEENLKRRVLMLN